MLEVAFFQFLLSQRTPLEGIKKFCKEKVVGGASITGDTLARALGRPMKFIQKAGHLESPQFDIAAISFNTPGASRAYREATRLKGLGKTVLAGGPHPSALPKEALQYFDAICIGAGDAQFLRMIEDIEGGQLKQQYYGRQGDWVVPFRKVAHGLSLIQLSRGCLKNCRYCIVPVVFPDGVDDKPLDLVAHELEQTSSLLSIIDDNFLPKTRWGKQVLALLKETGKRFICQVSPETALDQDSIDLLASSGCTLVGVGLESISNNSLQFLGKTPVKDPGEVIKRIQDADMGCYLNMLFGSDGETPGIFEETLRFLEEARRGR